MTDKQAAASEESKESNIYLIRGQKVMLGIHLAEIYEIGQRALNQAVERNIECFPENSVFQLSAEEIAGLKLQPATSGPAETYAFTRHGVAALSSILFDERAIHESQETCAPRCSCRK